MKNSPRVGFIGQGFIGKNYADDFENRGYSVVRYSLDKEYVHNKESISECDIVFIAVPTPSTPDGFEYDAVRVSLSLIGESKIAVIKSTMLPGTTRRLQEEFPDIYVFHSPEFLREVSAAHDAANPERNIVGISELSDKQKEKAETILSILPTAPYRKICLLEEAEIIKYAGNNFLTMKVVYMNMIYDTVQKLGCDWDTVRESLVADTRIGKSHTNPVHDGGRGAGGHCFIKDFSAFRGFAEETLEDPLYVDVLRSLEKKNVDLLKKSGKSSDLLQGIYGTLL